MNGVLKRKLQHKFSSSLLSSSKVPCATTSFWMKPRSSPADKESVSVDNPCWGDANHCHLLHLLSLISKSKAILYESPDYLVLNKPPDLRMDGPFPSSVFKLLTYWYPTPSLLSENSDKDENSHSTATQNSLLLKKLETLHRHSDLPDNALRPCHQLDYATSGVLLMARSAKAAAHAVESFTNRLVHKVYTAVLYGHLTLDKELPVIPPTQVDEILQRREQQYKRAQDKRKRPDTFDGFQPPYHYFQLFRARYLRKQRAVPQEKKRRRKHEKLTPEQWQQVDDALQLSAAEQAEAASMKAWKELQQNLALKQAMERAADTYNNLLRENIQQAEQINKMEKDLPTVFRVQGENDQSLYVYLSVAETDDDFAMRIPSTTTLPTTSDGNHHSTLCTADPDTLNFKVAFTRITIQAHASLHNKPVTKVQLEPRTGRRHQLRVHTAFLGHAIVGDQTYASSHQQDLSSRMCLHAHHLKFPLPEATKPIQTGDKIKGNQSPEWLEVTAPEPFVLREDRQLAVSEVL